MRPFVVFYVVSGRSHSEVVYAGSVEDAKTALIRKYYKSRLEVIAVGKQSRI